MVWMLLTGAIVLFGIIMLIIGIIDGNRFVVVEETIKLPKLEKDCRFVMLSDLHNKVYGEDNEAVLEAIRAAQPDFVVFVGDLVTSHVNESMEPGVRLMNAIGKEYKVYYAMGNHETKIRTHRDDFGNRFEELMEQIKHPNVTVLQDAHCVLSEYRICMTGLELERTFFARFKKKQMPKGHMETHIGKADDSYCNILLAHNPIYFEEYADWGADLVLSGHVHGGIMRLPVIGGVISPAYTLFPKYDGGIFRKNRATMLLGRGMGSHTIPLRFFNPAELYVVNCLRFS